VSAGEPKRAFARRPGEADAWVRTPEPVPSAAKADLYTARLTVDVTAELRGRIKVAAFRRGQTVADMLRAMLEAAFPDDGGGGS